MKYETPRLRKVATGSGQKNLLLSTMRDFKVTIHDRKRQKQICSLLGLLDDKIEINNKINTELEAMAKTIYDYWFLQFEFPNEEGKPYKSSGGKMVWNEELKREIPEGWTNGLISDLGEIISGGTPSTKHDEYYSKNGIAWVTPYDLSKTTDKYITHGEKDISQKGLEKSSAKLMPKGSILLTSRAPIGYIGISSNEVTTNQGFKSIVPYNKSNSEYIYYLLKSIIPYLKSLGNGSTFAEISKETLSNIPIVIPNKDIIDNFNNKVIHLGKIREIKEQENRELTSLRDFLLPLLMNGQVGFKEDKAEG
ncbi:restriction endonuclease subunit S [Megamonas funiformis]|uniref:restriction endonuclease subunit S n=1 Tax=Megamonas funiformis TaxID=437897 RepID=UPI00224FD1FB|nr:restriction endonuclease subunit S [Megamonas funiformis]MCX4131406.1 restriction endonuclease subunit S [Megamonas funiformis]